MSPLGARTLSPLFDILPNNTPTWRRSVGSTAADISFVQTSAYCHQSLGNIAVNAFWTCSRQPRKPFFGSGCNGLVFTKSFWLLIRLSLAVYSFFCFRYFRSAWGLVTRQGVSRLGRQGAAYHIWSCEPHLLCDGIKKKKKKQAEPPHHEHFRTRYLWPAQRNAQALYFFERSSTNMVSPPTRLSGSRRLADLYFFQSPTSRSPSCRTPLQLFSARVFTLAANVRLCCCYSNLIIILLLSTATRKVVCFPRFSRVLYLSCSGVHSICCIFGVFLHSLFFFVAC